MAYTYDGISFGTLKSLSKHTKIPLKRLTDMVRESNGASTIENILRDLSSYYKKLRRENALISDWFYKTFGIHSYNLRDLGSYAQTELGVSFRSLSKKLERTSAGVLKLVMLLYGTDKFFIIQGKEMFEPFEYKGVHYVNKRLFLAHYKLVLPKFLNKLLEVRDFDKAVLLTRDDPDYMVRLKPIIKGVKYDSVSALSTVHNINPHSYANLLRQGYSFEESLSICIEQKELATQWVNFFPFEYRGVMVTSCNFMVYEMGLSWYTLDLYRRRGIYHPKEVLDMYVKENSVKRVSVCGQSFTSYTSLVDFLCISLQWLRKSTDCYATLGSFLNSIETRGIRINGECICSIRDFYRVTGITNKGNTLAFRKALYNFNIPDHERHRRLHHHYDILLKFNRWISNYDQSITLEDTASRYSTTTAILRKKLKESASLEELNQKLLRG